MPEIILGAFLLMISNLPMDRNSKNNIRTLQQHVSSEGREGGREGGVSKGVGLPKKEYENVQGEGGSSKNEYASIQFSSSN